LAVRRLSDANSSPAPPTGGTTIQPQAGFDYLSDMILGVGSNGWGLAEKNRQQRRIRMRRCRTIHAQRHKLRQGLGVHASSTITYNLNNQYKGFFTDVGLDDEVGNGGSAAFQVFLDNVKVYDSGLMNGGTATKSISLDVSGKSQLKLVMTDGGTATRPIMATGRTPGCRNRRPVSTTPTTPTTPAPAPRRPAQPGSATSIGLRRSTLGRRRENRSNGENGSATEKTRPSQQDLCFRHWRARGLGHQVQHRRQVQDLPSDIGIDKETGGRGTVVFQVWADGKLKYDSGVVRGADAAKSLTVDVTGAKELRLVVTTANDGNITITATGRARS